MENAGVETAVYSMLDNFPAPALWSESDPDELSRPAADDSSASEDVPSCLADKSPVSLLQELCVKRGLTSLYELMESDGPVHNRVFTYHVTAGTFMATGKGISIFFSLADIYTTFNQQRLILMSCMYRNSALQYLTKIFSVFLAELL